MPGIPNAMDKRMAEVSDMAASVVLSLQTLRRTPGFERQLQERLQVFVDTVTELANEIISNR